MSGATEARYRLLLERAPVGQAIYDLSGRLVEVNAAWADLLGYEPSEVLGRRALGFVHPDDRPPLSDQVDALLSGEVPVLSDERRLLRKDGSACWVSSKITVRRDDDGTPIEFHSLVIDISDLKAVTEALTRSESRSRAVVEALSEGILIYGEDGLQYASPGALGILGSSFEELREHPPFSTLEMVDEDGAPIPPDERPGIVALRTGRPAPLRTIGASLDGGARRWFLMSASPWFADGPAPPSGVVVSFSEITDRKRAEDERAASEARYRAVIEALDEGLVIVGHHEVLAANPAASRLLGIDLDALGGRRALGALLQLDVRDLDGAAVPREQLASHRVLTEGVPVFREERLIRPAGADGHRRIVVNAVPLRRDGDGPVDACVVSLTDVTEQRLAEEALRSSEDRFRTLAEELPVAVFLADRRGELVYTNPQWRELTGRPAGRALADPSESVIHPSDLERVQAAMRTAIAAGEPYHLHYRIRRPDQSGDPVRWVSSRGAPLLEDGRVVGTVGFLEDITPLVAAQEETARLADIVESTSDLVSIIDLRAMRFAYLNRAARAALGLSDDVEVTSLSIADVHTPEATARFFAEVEPRLLTGRGWTGELDVRGADGSVMQIWQASTPALDAEGAVRWASSLGRDVTERSRLEAELAHRATHDPLTDLPNRTRLLEQLEEALGRVDDDRFVAVLFLDLDRFKQVNDLYGHEVGDLLLAEVADRIGGVLRPDDTVARLGGDEFVILCADVVDEAEAVEIGTRITEAIEHRPFPLGDVALAVTASVGIALSSGAGAHSEELLRDADAAMYRAKDQGRARLELFDEAMRRRTAHRLALTDELARAIEHDEIEVHYQPCIDLGTGRVTGVEALARWRHPTRGLLAPKEFIGLAEESGLIVGLGLAVLRAACADARRWADAAPAAAPRLHVNLSARQVVTTDLPGVVAEVLAATGLPSELLCLEITESVLMDDTETAVAVLTDLADLGAQIAIDDFGTGYSSLSYLRRFPVDVLKIDGSFVEALGPDPGDAAFVGAIVNLAHGLGLDAVAEGVETPDQLTRLRLLGCGSAQGYLFSPPRPARDIPELLATTFPL